MLVHDAVRPFVDQETILGVIEAVKKYEAAIAGVPAVDTVKQVDRTADGAVVIATVPRERMVLAQTPQGFRFGLLKKAFDEAMADGFMGTDEASLIERSGGDRSRRHGLAAKYEDHNSRRSGAGGILPVAGKPPQGEPGRVSANLAFQLSNVACSAHRLWLGLARVQAGPPTENWRSPDSSRKRPRGPLRRRCPAACVNRRAAGRDCRWRHRNIFRA